ncbi:MAG TPA: EAL domain-containing protein [Bryobacteraceae bacterium]|nr:EAL domain-containing protein [Bryobacteraceae bacterium]
MDILHLQSTRALAPGRCQPSGGRHGVPGALITAGVLSALAWVAVILVWPESTVAWAFSSVAVLLAMLWQRTRELRVATQPLEVVESELAVCQDRLNLLQETPGLGYWEFDLTSRFARSTSIVRSPFELTDETIAELEATLQHIHPEDRQHVRTMMHESITSECVNIQLEYRVLRPGGRAAWLHVRGKILREHDGRPIRIIGATLDVTSLKVAQLAAQESEERFRAAFAGASIGMAVSNLDGRCLESNETACRMTGYSREEMLARDFRSILHPDDTVGAEARMRSLVDGSVRHYIRECRVLRKDGSVVWVRLSVSLVLRDGAPAGFVSLCEDIHERKIAEEKLDYQRSHDLVTGVLNRRAFTEKLGAALNAGDSGALLWVEISGVSALNTMLGHAAGDKLLAVAAERLSEGTEGAVVGRFGGEQFTVLLPGPEAVHDAGELASKLLHDLSEPYLLDAREWEVTAEIGISVFPKHSEDPAKLLQFAEEARTAARALGSKRWLYYSPQHSAARRDRVEIESALRGATGRGEVEVVYQPEFDLRTGQLVRFEALSRWYHPQFGPVSPARFIPVAEDSGLIVRLGAWVLETACHRAARWNAELAYPPVGVGVNVSTIQFLQEDFVDVVLRVLDKTGLDPALLQLELTESIAMPGFESCLGAMTRLRTAGVSLALDDFGTGYSSLSYLRRLPFDVLKIDRSFVRDLETDPTALAMLQSLLALAHNFSMQVVVEGVETTDQLRVLQQIGCDEVQGYLLGRPGGDPERYLIEPSSTLKDDTLARRSRRSPQPAVPY